MPAAFSRREFLGTSAVAALAAAPAVHAGGGDVLRVGLVGCGGRGSGAAVNALNADPNTKLVAVGDLFADFAQAALQNLKASEVGNRVEVPAENVFSGWDNYKGVIERCDVVILATSPHFRPMHLKAAVEAGKHVFCEKPVAVDAPGVRDVIQTCQLAQQRNLNVVSGLCYRYDLAKQEVIQRIHDGAVGDLVYLQTNYLTTGLWLRPRQPNWSDMEWQIRNWLYFTWLSGDHIVEQHIHSLDKMLWVMKDVPPTKVTATGGRTQRTQPQYGNIYDHFTSVFEWEDNNNLRCFAQTRQWNDTAQDTSDWVYGTKGTADIMNHRISGENRWRRKPSPENMYDTEHKVLFNAIRNGQVINNGDYMTKSTLMAIMARLSAYSGRTIKWDEAMASQERLGPTTYEFGPLEVAPVAVPGQFRFI